MTDENPYESGPVEPKSGRSLLWIIALAVLGLAGITCLPVVIGILAYALLLDEAVPPKPPIPVEVLDESQIPPDPTIESMPDEPQKITEDVENDGDQC